MQFYTDVTRETEEHALPDAEVFENVFVAEGDGSHLTDDLGDAMPNGFYWWACFPGCLPDSDPYGPFETEEDAIADARSS